jgi:hypothetical protein
MQRNAKGTQATKRAATTTVPAKSELALAAQVSPPRQKVRAAPRPKRRADTSLNKQQTVAGQQTEQRKAEALARLKAERIQELLVRARRNYADGRVIEPAADNAASLYNQVLALDPTQVEAVAGAKRIVGVLAEEVERAAVAGDKGRAEQYIAQIRTLQPADPSLLGLQARLQALNSSPVVLSSRQQDRYSRSAQSIDRARSYLDNQPLNIRTIDQVIDEYDRAAALVPLAPGLPLLKDRIIATFPEVTRAELANDKSKRALKVVQTARERGWFSPELEPLEAQAKAKLGPGAYNLTLAECPDSVAQACAPTQAP